LVGKQQCFPTHYFNNKKKTGSLLPPFRVRKMGLSETIFKHHNQMIEKLVAIFLHFLTKQITTLITHRKSTKSNGENNRKKRKKEKKEKKKKT
jgi:hypothetical protein